MSDIVRGLAHQRFELGYPRNQPFDHVLLWYLKASLSALPS